MNSKLIIINSKPWEGAKSSFNLFTKTQKNSHIA